MIKKIDLPATLNQKGDVKHELKHVDGMIEKPDFFLASGFAAKTESSQHVKVCGHS